MKLDHIVYFTARSPESVVAEQQKSGRHAVIGGSHERWGTQNALLYTNNAYIEWLSVEDVKVAMESNHQLTRLLLHDLKQGDGWGTICLSVDDIADFEMYINQKGFDTSGVIKALRKTPDGGVKRWKMLFINQEISDQLPFPFFIEWEETDKVRFDRLRKEGTILPSNELLKVKKCIFNTDDPDKTASQWSLLLGKEKYSTNSIILSNILLKFLPANNVPRQRLAKIIME